jgi:hypothetical protein
MLPLRDDSFQIASANFLFSAINLTGSQVLRVFPLLLRLAKFALTHYDSANQVRRGRSRRGRSRRASSSLPHKNPPDTFARLTSKKADTTGRLTHLAFNPFFGGRYSVGACAAFPDITATHIRETD